MTLTQAIDEMTACLSQNQKRFDIDFVQADRTRRTAGRLRTLHGCYCIPAPHNPKRYGVVNVVSQASNHPIVVHTRLITKVNGRIVL